MMYIKTIYAIYVIQNIDGAARPASGDSRQQTLDGDGHVNRTKVSRFPMFALVEMSRPPLAIPLSVCACLRGDSVASPPRRPGRQRLKARPGAPWTGPPPARPRASPPSGLAGRRRGRDGVSTNGVTANFMFFDGGTFWVLLLTYFHFPKSARAYLFPQSVEIPYFCSGPIGVDPICPQPRHSGVWDPRFEISSFELARADPRSEADPQPRPALGP